MIVAPWSKKQCDALNAWQKRSGVQRFMCSRHGDGEHKAANGVLVATRNGWRCMDCPYTQTWAHDFMAEPEARAKPIDAISEGDTFL